MQYNCVVQLWGTVGGTAGSTTVPSGFPQFEFQHKIQIAINFYNISEHAHACLCTCKSVREISHFFDRRKNDSFKTLIKKGADSKVHRKRRKVP